ncbi:hypothetical protein BCR44DRAFT_49408 [Catenaria anguillulae PL171]|uniref:Uncharacterized protein n=1 Tax=Catenaria anguillulae PL171 TaxID=765915 RepID=A0A1Y2HKU8_9FUNG|nr:hypothetical protein BCR44DRAFT_49408 [Catenaria anguillulae PL171]
MASQTLASPRKHLVPSPPATSSEPPHSPSLLAAQLLHMVDSDEKINQGPPSASGNASQDFRNHPARAYQHSAMGASLSNVPASSLALTLPPEPPGPPIPVPASANVAATGAASTRYRQGSGPTSTSSSSGWRGPGPTGRDPAIGSRSRHSTSSAAASPASSLINAPTWATSAGASPASPAHNPLAGYESLLPEHLLQQAKESLGSGSGPPTSSRTTASSSSSSSASMRPRPAPSAPSSTSSGNKAAAMELPPALRGKLATLDSVQPSDPIKLEENLEALSKLAPFGGIGAPPARSGAYASASTAAVMQGQSMGLIAKSHPAPPAVLASTPPPLPPPPQVGARARNATHPVVDLHGGVRGEPYKSGSTVDVQRAGTPPQQQPQPLSAVGASSSFLERLNARRATTARVPSPPTALMANVSKGGGPAGPLSAKSLTGGFEGGSRRESPPSVGQQPGSAGPFASTFGTAAARQSPGPGSRGNSMDLLQAGGGRAMMEQWWMSDSGGNQQFQQQQSAVSQQNKQMDHHHRYMTSPAAAPTYAHREDASSTTANTVMSPPTPFAPTHHLPPPSPLYTAAWDQQQQQHSLHPRDHAFSHTQQHQQLPPRPRRASGAPPMQHMYPQHAYGGGPLDHMYSSYHHHMPPAPQQPPAHPQHQLAQHAMAMMGTGTGIPALSPTMPDLLVPDLKRAVEAYLRDGQEALLSEYLHFLSYCHPAAAVRPYIKSLLTIGIKLKARERLVAAVYFGMKHGHYSVREVMETLATLDLGVIDLVQGGVAIMMIAFLLACMLKDSVVSPVELEWLGKQYCASDQVSGQRLAGTLVANLHDIMSQPEFIAVMGLLNLHDLFGEQSAGKIAFQLARYLDVSVVQNVLKSSGASAGTTSKAAAGSGGSGASPTTSPNAAAPSIAA